MVAVKFDGDCIMQVDGLGSMQCVTLVVLHFFQPLCLKSGERSHGMSRLGNFLLLSRTFSGFGLLPLMSLSKLYMI
ncbi:hypothetical protein MKW98_004293, partial [Papaver atlanticum]